MTVLFHRRDSRRHAAHVPRVFPKASPTVGWDSTRPSRTCLVVAADRASCWSVFETAPAGCQTLSGNHGDGNLVLRDLVDRELDAQIVTERSVLRLRQQRKPLSSRSEATGAEIPAGKRASVSAVGAAQSSVSNAGGDRLEDPLYDPVEIFSTWEDTALCQSLPLVDPRDILTRPPEFLLSSGTLVVCPSPLLSHWTTEVKKWFDWPHCEEKDRLKVSRSWLVVAVCWRLASTWVRFGCVHCIFPCYGKPRFQGSLR